MPGQVDDNKAMRILIVDDDEVQRSLLHSFLRIQGFQTALASSGEEAMRLLGEKPFDMMISDVRMPGLSGLETMRRARAAHATLPILLVTAYADIREAVAAMRDGALNYLSKPIDLDELLVSVRQAVGLSRNVPVKFESKQLPAGLVAASPLMRAVFRDASLVADADSRILITGESGTGKQVLAEVIHQWSSRAPQPFVKVNCAAFAEAELDHELFGGMNGAEGDRPGQMEKAARGTILLDQISELPPSLQSKLFRLTETGRFIRGGSNTEVIAQARILAATNCSLEDRIKEGRFREELFYRLSVVELHMPPLRERREDILPLASHFLEALTNGRAKLSPPVSNALKNYSWPGNVRELRNAMERAALLSRGELVLPEHLPGRVRPADILPGIEAIPAQPLEEVEEQAILAALRAHNFNRTDTARALGISRRGLIYKLQHLRERGFKVDPEQ